MRYIVFVLTLIIIVETALLFRRNYEKIELLNAIKIAKAEMLQARAILAKTNQLLELEKLKGFVTKDEGWGKIGYIVPKKGRAK